MSDSHVLFSCGFHREETLKGDVAVEPVERIFLRCRVQLNVCESCCLDSDCSPAALPALNEAECTHVGDSTHRRTLNENIRL